MFFVKKFNLKLILQDELHYPVYCFDSSPGTQVFPD